MFGKKAERFDPFGWLERYFSAKTLHTVIRAFMGAVLLIFLIHRVLSYNHYLFKPLWVVETLIYAVFLIIFIIRKDPVERSQGVQEIIIPLIGGVWPFALLLSPVHPWIAGSQTFARAVFIWMSAASCLTLWGLWTLRRSFSITVEARELVTNGPYRLVRHPVYLGEMLTAAAVTVWRFSAANVVLLVGFIAVQLYRCRMEERKLARIFPGYSDFYAKSAWFWTGREKS